MRIPSPEWTQMVMKLYRDLLREGRKLKLTDKDYYRRTVRCEFERQRDEVEVMKIKKQYEVKEDVGVSVCEVWKPGFCKITYSFLVCVCVC